MGSALNKDSDVQIFLTLKKRVFYANQFLEGAIHISCVADRPYSSVRVRIQGLEEVYWTEEHDKKTIVFSNRRESYFQDFQIIEFKQGIRLGHYSFPFSIKLPLAMPASFRIDLHNFIRYSIAVYLPAFGGGSTDQMFRRSLHIREPYRGIPRPIGGQAMKEAICWGCCCGCGFSKLAFEADVAFLQHAKIFHIRGTVDNTGSQTDIKSCKIALKSKTKRIASDGSIREAHDSVLIYDSMRPVFIGSSDSFQTETKVPEEVLGYTAIGNIISRAYFLLLIAEVHCCYSNPFVEVHVVLNNELEPDLQSADNPETPLGWSPVEAQPILVPQIKKYTYQPCYQIEVHNQQIQTEQGSLVMMNPSMIM